MTRKTAFFLRGGLGSGSIIWDLALGENLKFYTSVVKGLKLKVRKFLELIPTFVKVTGENLVGGLFTTPPPPILNRVKITKDICFFCICINRRKVFIQNFVKIVLGMLIPTTIGFVLGKAISKKIH